MPFGHASHAAEKVVAAAVAVLETRYPAPHVLHEANAALSAYLPMKQSMQVASGWFVSRYFPAAQGLQESAAPVVVLVEL